MFHLKFYLRAAKYLPVSHAMHVLGAAFILFTCTYFREYQEFCKAVVGAPERPYFSVLYQGDKQAEMILQDFKKLPGVEVVTKIESAKVAKAQQAFLNSMAKEMIGSVAFQSPLVFRISITNGLSERSKSLIRDYVQKYLGEDKTLLGQITSSQVIHSSFRTFLTEFLPFVIPLFVFFLAVLPFMLRLAKQQKRFLPFQRRPGRLIWGQTLLLFVACVLVIAVGEYFGWTLMPIGLIASCVALAASAAAVSKLMGRQIYG